MTKETIGININITSIIKEVKLSVVTGYTVKSIPITPTNTGATIPTTKKDSSKVPMDADILSTNE